MRKTLLLLIFTFFFSAIFAQGPNKISFIWTYLHDGLLKDAKNAIEKAENNPAYNDWYKLYYLKGETYLEISMSEEPEYQALCNNCLDTSYHAFLKSIRLNFINEEYKKIDLKTEKGIHELEEILKDFKEENFIDSEAIKDILKNMFPSIINSFINKGVASYQTQEYKTSLQYFEKAMEISRFTFKIDTQLYHFTSLAAAKAENYDRAIEINKLLIEIRYGETQEDKASIFLNQANAYKTIGDTTNMLKILEEGIKQFEHANESLVIELFNHYIFSENNEKAYDLITRAIENDSTNSLYYVIRGVLLEVAEKSESAKKDYEYALHLDPECFDANYSLGVFYYNKALDSLVFINTEPTNNHFDYPAKDCEYADSLLRLSLIYLEKAFAQESENIDVLHSLLFIYNRFGKLEKHEEIKSKIERIENRL